MSQLVRDDEFDLRRTRAVDERVEEDDAPRSPDARDVCIQLARPAARVGDEDRLDGDAGACREGSEARLELAIPERSEVVEEWLEHDRSYERQRKHDESRDRSHDYRPADGP